MGEIVERLPLEAFSENTLLTTEHLHRYEVAARMCEGLRVADVCCGTGYGSEMLAVEAESVLGIDNDVASIDNARVKLGDIDGLAFQVDDAHDFLRSDLAADFDAIVMFEGLEHLSNLDDAVQSLKRLAKLGLKLIVSVPNSKTFDEENPYHVTDFDFELARSLFEDIANVQMLYQFNAEGSLIRGADGSQLDTRPILEEYGKLDYANHFLACINFDEQAVEQAFGAKVYLTLAPTHNRYVISLERANRELWRTNQRIHRWRLFHGAEDTPKADSAAAAVLGKAELAEDAFKKLREYEEALEAAEERAQDYKAAMIAAETQALQLKGQLEKLGASVNTSRTRERRG